MSEPNKSANDGFSQTPRLPFVSILLVYAFGGSVFLAFNAPLLVAYFADSDKHEAFSRLMQRALIEPWDYVLFSAPQASLAFGALFFSVVLGLVVKPVDQAHAEIWTTLVAWFSKRIKRVRHIGFRLFRPSRYAAAEYASQVAWLMKNQSARAHWEYELLLYIAHWSLAFNVLCFWLLCALHLGVRDQLLVHALLASAWLVCVLFAIAKAVVMGDTHDFYSQQAAHQPITTDTPER